MCWYSATAWENDTMKYSKTTCSFSQMILHLLKNSYHNLVVMLLLVLQNKFYLMRKRLESKHKLLNVFFEKEHTTHVPWTPKKEGLKLSCLEPQDPSMSQKCHVKEGPVKFSKKLKFTPKDDVK